MEKRVYGVLGIRAIMANWNADFTGFPKSLSSGEVFGSDKALKYPMKKMWEANGEKVLYIKSLQVTKNDEKSKKDKKDNEYTIRPKTLSERYNEIFDCNLKEDKNKLDVLTNLFNAIDVKNFGATFAEEKNNISITGAVQIGQGMNKYEGTYAEEQQILSPFRDSSKEDAEQSTLGTKIVSNEAHYFYPFAINSDSYNDYVKIGVTAGYTEEDYAKFKEAALCAATYFNSNSKLGCENELAIFIETKKGYYLPDLSQYIEFRKEGKKNIISLNFSSLINEAAENIISTEIYYNSLNTVIEHDIKGAKKYNIFTKREV